MLAHYVELTELILRVTVSSLAMVLVEVADVLAVVKT